MTQIDHGKSILCQPLRRVTELSELHEGDIVLMVANCSPEGEEDAKHWHSMVTTVVSSHDEFAVHFAGSTWTVRLAADPEDGIINGDLDPATPGDGTFTSGGGYWLTQLYLLLSAVEIQQRAEERGEMMEKGKEER